MSQIGYMLFSLGVARYGGEQGLGFTASMFHLFTHAFFKALLFLGAGTVIHYVHSNEMKDMGGLRKHLPLTHASFLIACLSIAGIPFFSGFFSKEEILLAAYESDPTIYWVALFTSGLTAFYMFRLYFSIFWNKDSHAQDHHHGDAEGGLVMKLPLLILAIATLATGYVSFGNFVSSDGKALEGHLHLLFSVAPVCFALAGIAMAYQLYKKESEQPAKLATHWGRFYTAALNKFYIDEFYLFVTKKILFNGVARFAAWFDVHVINALVNGLASLTEWVSQKIKGFQSGKVQQYAMVFLGSLLVIAWILLYVL
jgi:NADH-quinone oxidoreductase subunit L